MKAHLKALYCATLFGGFLLVTGFASAEAVPNGDGGDVSGAATNKIMAVVAPQVPDEVKLSPAVENVVKMAQSGLGDAVLIAYIQASPESFNLSADEILYLTDIGLSESVLAAMLSHDGSSKELLNQAKEQTPAIAGMPAGPAGYSIPDATGLTATPNNPAGIVPPGEPPNGEGQDFTGEQQPVVTYDTFYTSLAPYGSWVDVPAYGWCWEPTVGIIDSDWQPYDQHGRWLYSDCGWYWQSDYSWGWAPFHYGRWYRPNGRRWCWVPDRIWGPSWVSWREGSGYYGWAPLPPEARFRPGFGFSFHNARVGADFDFGLGANAYRFVPAARFYDRASYRHTLARSESATIFNHSRVVNYYTAGNHDTVINHGIDPTRVAAATHIETRSVVVRDLPTGAGAIHPDRLRKQGDEYIVYRPSPGLVTGPNRLRPQTAEHLNVNHAGAFSGPVANVNRENEAGHSRPVLSSPFGEPAVRTPGLTANERPIANSNIRNVPPNRGASMATMIPNQSRPAWEGPRNLEREEPSRVPETVVASPKEGAPRYTAAPVRSTPYFREQPIAPQQPVASHPSVETRPYSPPPQPHFSAPPPVMHVPAPTPASAPQPAARAATPSPAPSSHPTQGRRE